MGQIAGIIADLRAGRDCQSLGGLDYGWDFALLAYPGVFVPVSIPVRARLRLGPGGRTGRGRSSVGFNPCVGQITVGTAGRLRTDCRYEIVSIPGRAKLRLGRRQIGVSGLRDAVSIPVRARLRLGPAARWLA